MVFVVFSARSSQFLKYFPTFALPFDTCLPEFARSLATSLDGSNMVTTTPDPELEDGGKSGFLGWFKVAKVAVIVLLR